MIPRRSDGSHAHARLNISGVRPEAQRGWSSAWWGLSSHLSSVASCKKGQLIESGQTVSFVDWRERDTGV